VPQLTVGEQSAELILARRAELAGAITRALYEAMPQLHEKYGDYGRARCLEDMNYNLDHLAAAVALGSPAVFVNYVHWADSLLRARNVPTAELIRSLELTREQLRSLLPPDEAAAADLCVHAGVEALGG